MKRALLAIAVVLLAAVTAWADVDVRVRLGHDKRWIADAVTPVAVRLTNTGTEPIEVDLEVRRIGLVTSGAAFHGRRVFLGASSVREEMFLIVGPEQWGSGVTVTLETSPTVPIHHGDDTSDKGLLHIDVKGERAGDSAGALYQSRNFGILLDDSGSLVKALGEATPKVDYFAGFDEWLFKIEALHVSPDVLALAPASIDGFDTLVVCDPDETFCAEQRALDGLLDWVALGGHLVISLGNRSAVFGSSQLADQLPARFGGSERRDYAVVHRTLLRMFEAKRKLGRLRRTQGPWTPLMPNAGATVIGDRGPLRVTRRFGLGHLSVVPFDVRAAASMPVDPLEKQRFLRLIELRPPEIPTQGDPSVSDGQWVHGTIANLLQEGAFEPPPLPCILLGLVAYVILVGPVDWFLLKRLKKERLTTITFAATVIGFTVIAYGATLFLFAGGARVNRVTFVDYVDAERDGRELIRVQDFAGYYSATGNDRDLSYSMPGVVCGSGLPDSSSQAQVGGALPVFVGGTDPLAPVARASIAIRSQRVVRTVLTGPAGLSVNVEWDGSVPRLINGLEIELTSATLIARNKIWRFDGPVAAGQEVPGRPVAGARLPGAEASFNYMLPRGHTPEQARATLLALSQAAEIFHQLQLDRVVDPEQVTHMKILRKAGIDRSASSLEPKRALLLATADEAPVPLPGAGEDGNTYVVIRKEVRRP